MFGEPRRRRGGGLLLSLRGLKFRSRSCWGGELRGDRRRRKTGVRERDRDGRAGEGERESDPATDDGRRRPGGVREDERETREGPRLGGERYLRGGDREPREEAIDADLSRRGGERETLRPRP